ncbi:hypothetical protein [Spongiactinospora sp. TRM90649]|uniref:hypothetical protein n=1 Tax=Spongiactinospora sp. TRM90649 TaxID=3031114 RepID=UPI0023F8166D|nr:hypothetical protein [Spongiactinospora sp. TRM90649]MDF5755563.1 hypothetical protein [Spongiactinospora sp. TRM90649]
MNLVVRVAVVLVCVATLTACSEAAPEPPSFDTAKQALMEDAAAILASAEVKASAIMEITDRAEKDDTGDCRPGKVQRFFRAKGNLREPARQSPGMVVGWIGSRLGLKYYDPVVDNLDLWDDNLSVEVLRKPSVAVTFVIAARTTKPNLLIVGKTDCFSLKK